MFHVKHRPEEESPPMVTLDVTDHVINYRPAHDNGGGLYPTWGLSADGTRIGTVWETEHGYAGHIEGETAIGDRRQYTCPEMAGRSLVIKRLEEMAERLAIA
jgi:hypothetical protein